MVNFRGEALYIGAAGGVVRLVINIADVYFLFGINGDSPDSIIGIVCGEV